ncbi:hypothetical protein PR202_ga03934 [Eleusine coracana subsp. coracana]|uniref:PIR2-like helical domain-containing protein n=1 Tax=Eleusine coracana subsp. coracana TaxID=191504 RepID=A0AAV5BNQ1_ELECO|nr:hypothetical protein PR202_ga03934 [Eleusine coracana subsp. coracana]
MLNKIHIYYRDALKLLNVKAKRGMAVRFLYGGGLCFGLLDPVSNIVANTLIPYKRCTRKEGRLDKREPVAVPKGMLKDLERRSLDALVNFLIRFFPNLAECQAVRYLLLADADLLVASRIVLCDVGMRRFGSSEVVVQEALSMALKCAVLAARHPEPDRLVRAWSTLSSRHVVLLTQIHNRSSSYLLRNLARLLGGHQSGGDGFEDMWLPWHLAAARDPGGPCTVPFKHTSFLKRTLQDMIHGFYLQALARLPAGELRSRFHRSLVKAGSCYGPLDPVSNIIINTIWYDAAFPPTRKLERDKIGNLSLHRMENCSLYGLASFLCTRYHQIDFHQAVRCLLRADANLILADPNLGTENAILAAFSLVGSQMLGCKAPGICSPLDQDRFTQALHPDTGIEQAFLAAAKASHHPNPDAQVKFLTSCRQMLGSVFSLLQGSTQLSSKDVNLLAALLCPEPPCEKPLLPFPLTDYPASTSKHSKGAGVLFFAELSNDGKGTSFCLSRVLAPIMRWTSPLPYCDYVGARIVHPVGEDFHGHKHEFEKMVCGEDPCDDEFDPALTQPYYTNMDMINNSRNMAEMVIDSIKEDSLYDDSFVFCGNRIRKSLSCESSRDHVPLWMFALIPSSSLC